MLLPMAVSLLLFEAEAGASLDVRVMPEVHLTVRGAFGEPNEDWTFFLLRGEWNGYVVKRVRQGDPATTEWAIDEQCPGIRQSLALLSALPMPSPTFFDVPGATAPRPPPADGITYSIQISWGGWPDANAYGLEFKANVNSPLSQWASQTEALMSECWSEARPAILPSTT
jgi:hypothetical protein